MTPRPIALLTDYGYSDPFAGILRAVIASEDLSIPVIDLTHGIARHDVLAGAVALVDSARYLPQDAIVVAVVDPGVGTDRRAVAVESVDGGIFMGPDNGLLAPVILACGGAVRAVDIGESPWRLPELARTFDGRDVFAPVAAKLAVGGELTDAGIEIDVAELTTLELPVTETEGGAVTTAVLSVDTFGNARLAAGPADLKGIKFGDQVELETDDMRRIAVFAQTFESTSDNGTPFESSNDPLLLVDSTGSLAIAVNRGNAAESLRLTPGKALRIYKAAVQ